MSAPALRALADALEAGLSLRQLVDDRALASVFPARARASLKSLDSVARALFESGVVDEAGRAILEAGEQGGSMPRALRLVADDMSESSARKRRALAALAYPAFLVVAASLILPLPALVTGGVHAYLARSLPGLAAIGALAIVFRLVPGLTNVLARVPVIGAVVVDNARASCFDVLGRLLGAGVPALRALPSAIAAGALTSWRASSATDALGRGAALTDALVAAGVVDADSALAGRIAIGERTGKLDATFPLLAGEARDRSRRRFMALTAVAGVACFLAIALAIGSAVVGQTRDYFHAIDSATQE
jgi:type II secretory pathway component PulF